jgi:hypothetical protein
MLRNVDCSILMYHDKGTSNIEDFYRLSENEVSTLRSLSTADEVSYSQALIRVNKELNTTMKIEGTSSELELLNTEDGGGE